jgi:hypothetical protein
MSEYYILGEWDYHGVPKYLESTDDVNPTLIARIREALPEKESVPKYRPEYLLSTTERNIIIKTSDKNFMGADIWVSFLDEGAGYKNVFGYFVYDLNNNNTVPTKMSETGWIPMTYDDRDLVDASGKSILKKTIIFPNASLPFNGGNLRPGSKVKLLYDIENPSKKFPNNTGVGFFVIPNGWNYSKNTVQNAKNRVYSYDAFNYNGYVQSVFLNDIINSDGNVGRVILGFEDIMRPGGDEDYNDLVVQIDYTPSYAIQSQNFITLRTQEPIQQITYNADKTGLYLKFPEDSMEIINSSSASKLIITQTIKATSFENYKFLLDIFNILILPNDGIISFDEKNNTIIIKYIKNIEDMKDFIYFIYSVDNSVQYSIADNNIKNIVQFQNHFVYDILKRIDTETIKIEDSNDENKIFYNQPLRPNTKSMGSPLAMGDPHIITVKGIEHEIPDSAKYVELLDDRTYFYMSCSINKFEGNQMNFFMKNLTFIDKLFISYMDRNIIIDMFVPGIFYDIEMNKIYELPCIFNIEKFNQDSIIKYEDKAYVKKGLLQFKKLYKKVKFDVQYLTFDTFEYGTIVIELLYVPQLGDKVNSITLINENVKYIKGTGALLNHRNYIIGDTFPIVKSNNN